MANVTEMTRPEAAENPDSPAESTTVQTTPAPKPAKNLGGRPPKGSKQQKPEGKAPVFFEAVARVPKEDWGTRAFMYLYIDEPVCIAKTWGETRYAKKFHAPIFDLEPLKEMYGSFKGWLSLNIRKTGKDATDQTDRLDFEIFDPLAAPLIPVKTWANDARNDRWRALLPPEKPAPPQPEVLTGNTILEAVKVGAAFANSGKQEGSSGGSIVEAVRMGAELGAARTNPNATPAKDPLELATALATTFMQMKADNPMVDFLNKQMDRQHQEMMDLRKELAEARKEPTEKPKSFFDQLMEFAADDTKMDRIKKVAGVFGFGLDGGGRAPRTTPLEVMREVVNSPFGAQLGTGVSNLLSNLISHAEGTNGIGTAPPTLNPVPPNGAGAPANITHESDAQRIQRIASAITNPMIAEFFDPGETGDLFAERVFDFWPDDFAFLKKLGADTIVGLYKQHNAPLWQYITADPIKGNREADFRKFVTEFCGWTPPKEPAAAPGQPASEDGFEPQEKVQ